MIQLMPIYTWNDTAPLSDMVALRHKMTNDVMGAVKALVPPGSGAYMSEADPAEPDWKASFFGANYARLLKIKHTVDPDHRLYAPTTVASDEWAEDSIGRLCRV